MKVLPLRVRRGQAARLALAPLVLLGTLVGLAACRTSEAAPSRPRPSTETVKCQTQRSLDCRNVRLPNGRTVRYSVIAPTAQSGSTPGAANTGTLVDLGGPGLSLFGEHWPQNLRSSLGEGLAYQSLVLIEEPWVTSQPPAGCEQALSDWFGQWHNHAEVAFPAYVEVDNLAVQATVCDVGEGRYGWTPTDYRNTLTAIAHREHLAISGMIGISFGARRSVYLGGRLKWAVLANPAPLRMTADEFLSARHDATVKLLSVECKCSASEVVARLGRTYSQYARTPLVIARRSVLLTGADVGVAAIALQYQEPNVRQRAAAALLGSVTDPALIGSLADTVWNRIGASRISPASLAYLEEVCPAYPGWKTSPRVRDTIDLALVSIHSSCLGEPAGPPAVTEAPPRNSCVTFQSNDPVTPPVFALTWTLAVPRQVPVRGSEHSNLQGIGTCIAKLSQDRDST